MGGTAVIVDETYDELESALTGKSDTPGDEFTGVIATKPDEGGDTKVIIGEGDEGKKAGDDKVEKVKTDDDKAGQKGADDGKTAKDKGASAGDDDSKAGEKVTVDEGAASDDDSTTEQLLRERTELRQDLKEQRKEMAILTAKMTRLAKKQEDDNADDDEDAAGDDDGAGKPAETLSDIELYQVRIDNVAEERGTALSDMLEIMSLNSKYEDVQEVCSRSHLNDIIEAAAEGMVSKEGGDIPTAQLAVEANIWEKPNPYRYMYDIIKKYHPDYAEAAAGDDGKAGDTDEKKSKIIGKTPDDEAKERGKKLTKTAITAVDTGGGGEGKNLGEWTAERIDAMEEHELDKVPDIIYTKYLRGDLDK